MGIPHQLGIAEAKRIDDAFDKLAGEMSASLVTGLSRSWDGQRMSFSFGAHGQAIIGQCK